MQMSNQEATFLHNKIQESTLMTPVYKEMLYQQNILRNTNHGYSEGNPLSLPCQSISEEIRFVWAVCEMYTGRQECLDKIIGASVPYLCYIPYMLSFFGHGLTLSMRAKIRFRYSISKGLHFPSDFPPFFSFPSGLLQVLTAHLMRYITSVR